MANNSENKSRTLTRRDLAFYLQVSVRTVDRWFEVGYGPPRIKIGGTVLYTWETVDEWIDSEFNVQGKLRAVLLRGMPQ